MIYTNSTGDHAVIHRIAANMFEVRLCKLVAGSLHTYNEDNVGGAYALAAHFLGETMRRKDKN